MVKILQNRNILFPVIICLYLLEFFHPNIPFLLNIMTGRKYMLSILLLAAITFEHKVRRIPFPLSRLLCLMFIFVVVNVMTSYVFSGEYISESIYVWFSNMLIFMFFIFRTWNLKIEDWERILMILFSCVIFCYLLQYTFIGSQLFVLDTDIEYLEVESRVRIFSDGLLTLGALMCFNKYILQKKKLFLIGFIAATFFIFLQGFRMIILGYIISMIFVLWRVFSFSIKFLIYPAVGIVFLLPLSKLPIINEKIEEITTRNEEANFNNDDYVRVVLVDYYYTKHFSSVWELIFGTGRPFISMKDSSHLSEYSQECTNRADWFHFYPVDMGLIGLSWEAGIPYVLSYILLMIMIVRMKLPDEYSYISAWELLLLVISVTHPMCYYHNNMLYQAILLTMIYRIYSRKCIKNNISIK